jgi:hypothetical protein
MFKNVASQSIALFAFDITTGAAKTGDAANQVFYITKDWGSVTAIASNSGVPTEMDATNAKGWYKIAVSQTETNADAVVLSGKSSTANISVVGALVQTVPANYTTMVIDGSGRVDVSKVSGTSQTARDLGASVLLSTGTGTGQLDFTSGVVKANLAQILGTALTETAGQIAAAFKQWFNVAAPVGTVNSIPNATAGATGGLFIAGSNAATTANITGNLTGNVSGSVGSVTGAVGSVTGAVGSVTGAVGSVTGAVGSVTAGVTVTTNNDKTGYTASTVSDKTGYSLTQAFPSNFSSMAITAAGAVGVQSNVKKNTASTGFMFVLTDSTTHTPKTGVTVTAQRSIDGAAYASCANAVSEVSNGMYKIDLAAADVNGNHIMLRFTGTNTDDLNIELITEP